MARLLQAAYVVAWLAIVARLVINLGLTAIDAFTDVPDVHAAEISLPFDLAVSLSLLAFGLLALILRGVAGLRQVRTFPAVLALTIASLLAECVPLAAATRTPQGLDASQEGTPTAKPAETQPWFDLGVAKVDVRWFSAPNTLPGFWPYLVFGLVVLWAAVSGTSFLALTVRSRRLVGDDPADPAVANAMARRLDRNLRRDRAAWWIIAVNAMVVAPLLDWGQFLMLRSGVTPSTLADPATDPEVIRVLVTYCDLIIVPFVVVTSAVLFAGRLRAELAPLVELALDVMNYLPTFPRLDANGATRFFLGGSRGPDRTALGDVLRYRLRSLIELAASRHDGPVLLVGHSLGSIMRACGPGRMVGRSGGRRPDAAPGRTW